VTPDEKTAAPPVVLPPEAQEKKDALGGLFALAQSDDYPVQWEEQVNSREKRLRSITIATNLPATDGVVMAKVSPAIARAWSLFSLAKSGWRCQFLLHGRQGSRGTSASIGNLPAHRACPGGGER